MGGRLGLLLIAAVLAGCGGAGDVPRPTIDLSDVQAAPQSYLNEDLDHLRFLLTEAQQLEYLSLPPGPQRAELMRIVWFELDPTPTTEQNERLDEHYRRLAYVRRHFAIGEKPGWDRRGELLLRYGPPDRRTEVFADVEEGVGLVPPREVWVYAALGQAYRLEDPLFQGNFRDSYDLGGARGVASPRDIGAARDELEQVQRIVRNTEASEAFLEGPDPEEQLEQQRLQTMLSRGQEAYQEKPQSYRHDYGGEELEFVFDMVNFAGEDGRTRVEVNNAYWAGDLRYRKEGDSYVAVLQTRVAVRTMDYRDVTSGEGVTRDVKEAIDDLEGRLVLDRVGLDLDPGHYRLAISVQDSTSGNVGIYKTEFWVRPFPEGELRMSDIQRALDVRGGRPGDPFLRGPLQVVPYPLGTFPRERDIYLFFEAYGLELSPTGDSFYGVDFMIKPHTSAPGSWFGSSKGRLVPGVASTYEGTGKSSTVREYIVFDPTTFNEDVYDVEITVHDRLNDRSTIGSVTFAVQSR